MRGGIFALYIRLAKRPPHGNHCRTDTRWSLWDGTFSYQHVNGWSLTFRLQQPFNVRRIVHYGYTAARPLGS